MDEGGPLRCDRAGAVLVITLCRPEKRNAVNEAMLTALRLAVAGMAGDVRAVVLCGAGPHFCAGLDLTEQRERSPIEVMRLSRSWHAVMEAMRTSGRPVVAALQGGVIGGGFEMAAVAHVRVADTTAFFQLPEARRGFYIGGGGSVSIARVIGVSRMTDMMLTGRTMTAEKAEQAGLVHEVVAPGAARARAMALAEAIAGNAPLVNELVTTVLPRIADMSAAEGLMAESLAAGLSQSSADVTAGIDAFLGRRRTGATGGDAP